MEKYEVMAAEILEKVTDTEGLAEEKDLDLFDAGLLDSLSVISIIMEIEIRIGKALVPTDFQRSDIATIEAFAKFLAAKDAE